MGIEQAAATSLSAPPLDAESGRPLVSMRFRPAWTYIDGIREFGRFFCETTFGAPDLAERACVIIQETLENAIKYSTKGPNSELELSITAKHDQIQFSVTSLPEPAHVRTLREELSGIDELGAEEAYLAAFLRAAREPENAGRLGLARVRYEGNVELSMKEEEGGRVRITALARIWGLSSP